MIVFAGLHRGEARVVWSVLQRTIKLQSALDSCQAELLMVRGDRDRLSLLNDTLLADKQAKQSQVRQGVDASVAVAVVLAMRCCVLCAGVAVSSGSGFRTRCG